MTSTARWFRWPLDVVARPSELVATRADEEAQTRRHAVATSVRLLVVYFSNLLFYALPLTLAGFGVTTESDAPSAFVTAAEPLVADVDAMWQLMSAFVQNSAFLFVATVLTFVTFHFGVLLTSSSDGIVRSLRAVTYSTGIYLATMFTIVWYVSTASNIAVADDFLIAIQKQFIYYFIDRVGTDLGLPGGRPEAIDLANLTTVGQGLLVLLLLSAVYYLYVLYVGARISHRATWYESLVTVIFVLVSPAIYVLGTIFVTLAIAP